MNLQSIADRIDAVCSATIHGDPDTICGGAAPLYEATTGDVTLVDDVDRAGEAADTGVAAVICAGKLDIDVPQLIVDDPHAAFEIIIEIFRPAPSTDHIPVGVDSSARIDPSASIHPTATIGPDVRIGQRTKIYPGVVVLAGSRIGAGCVLHSGVTLYPQTRLGDRVVVHAGSILGAHGFGYRLVDGRHMATAQVGYVAIEDDVEIGAAVTIDRGTYGSTRVGEGTKIDNQVMIGHNCQIGKHNLICSQVGIAGSCRTGDHVVLAGQVGLKDHIDLGDGAIVGAQAGVMNDLPGGRVYLGSPATTQHDQMQIMAVQRRLPEMRKELKRLHRKVDSQSTSESEPAPRRRVA